MDNRNDKTLNRLVQLGLGLLISLLLTSQAQAAKELLFIHNDHLGTPQVVTNMDQTVVWEGKRKPFGETEEVVSDIDQPSGFPGQYLDPETGLYYNYMRDYDPSVGRYVQSDPIGLGGGFNTYAYVEGNALKYTDPSGLCGEGLCIGALYVLYEGCKWVLVRTIQVLTGAYLYETIAEGETGECDGGQCLDDDTPPPDRKNCEALKQSILNTCYGLRGRTRMACFEAANTAYRQCMGYE